MKTDIISIILLLLSGCHVNSDSAVLIEYDETDIRIGDTVTVMLKIDHPERSLPTFYINSREGTFPIPFDNDSDRGIFKVVARSSGKNIYTGYSERIDKKGKNTITGFEIVFFVKE